MFVCEPCRVRRNDPVGVSRSVGPCEVCSQAAVCWDIRPWQYEQKNAEATREEPKEKAGGN
jgi:hypothetical protein